MASANPDVAALDGYLTRCTRRLRVRSAARSLALAGALACLAWGFATAMAPPRAPGGAFWLSAAALLASACTVVAVVRQTFRRAVGRLEAAIPELDGRVATYVDASRRAQASPLLPLLAADALAIAGEHPPVRAVSHASILAPLCGAVLSAALLAALAAGGESASDRGVAAGRGGAGMIQVQPGSLTIALGTNVRVTARALGTTSEPMTLHALFGRDAQGAASAVEAWEVAPMRRAEGDTFSWSFVALDEPVAYFVSAGDLRSETFSIGVVELPRIERIKLVYRYPAWTHRAPREVEPGGDVEAVRGTEVDVEIQADRPLGRAVLVEGEAERPFEATNEAATVARATLRVEDAGTYSIAAVTGAGHARLAGEFDIAPLPDGAPRVRIERPGRDRQVSAFEELTTWVAAEDDHYLEAVELRYSLNGGPWVTASLARGGAKTRGEHVLYLEDLRTPSAPAVMSDDPGPGGDDPGGAGALARWTKDAALRPLAPGDVVAYYGVARDREQTAHTDMYFASVQRLDRRFSQSQQSGGGLGGGQGGLADIARRQREISVATFKLLPSAPGAVPPLASDDRVELLRELQVKLADQVGVLAERVRARGLDGGDAALGEMLAALDLAVTQMRPAARHLGARELAPALAREQAALQYLLHAEATQPDYEIGRGDGADGGGGSSGDLSELLAIETDTSKVTYEMAQSAAPSAGSRDEALADALRKLEELAYRQQQVAEALRRQQEAAPSRWQQERLRREVDELQRQLGQQSAQGSPASSSSQASDGGDAQRSGGASGGDRTAQALDAARNAMERAASAAAGGAPGAELARLASEAQAALERARDRVREERTADVQRQLDDFAGRADALVTDQQVAAASLEAALQTQHTRRRVLGGEGLSRAEEERLAAERNALRERLEGLRQDAGTASRALAVSGPEASRALGEAIEALDRSQIGVMLSMSAQDIADGRAGFAGLIDPEITEGLEHLRDALSAAAEAPGLGGEPANVATLRSALDETRRLRRALEDALPESRRAGDVAVAAPSEAAEGGPAPSRDAAGGEDASHTGPADAGGPAGRAEVGEGSEDGAPVGRAGGGAVGVATGPWTLRADDVQALRRELSRAGNGLATLLDALSAQGREQDAEAIAALRRRARGLAQSRSGDLTALLAGYRGTIAELERIEVGLLRDVDARARAIAGPSDASEPAAADRETVADYYRSLSDGVPPTAP